MKTRLLQAWHQLNDRERNLLLWGGVCLVVYLAYVVYAFLDEAVLENTRSLSEKKATLAWIQQAEKQWSHKKTGAQVLDGSKGLTVLSEQLKTTSFHAFSHQLQQLNEDEVHLSFDSVPYNAFLTWFSMMSKKYVLTVKEFHVDRTDTPGLVKLTVIIALHR